MALYYPLSMLIRIYDIFIITEFITFICLYLAFNQINFDTLFSFLCRHVDVMF
jgi:hypothetical protein